MDTVAPSTILFIHGLGMTPRSWEHWAARYEERGHPVFAPAWPGLEVEVEELRRDPAPLTRFDVPKIVDHHDRIIRELDAPPIVMGHSIGGTITQLLVDRGWSSAAVGIASATVKGVLDLPLSTLRSAFPVLGNPFNRGKAAGLSAKQFHYAFGNTTSREPKASRHNAEKYGKSGAVTVFKEFPGRPHFPGAPGREEVAGYVLDWALETRRS